MATRVRKMPAELISQAGGTEWADLEKKSYIKGPVAYIPVKDGYPADETLLSRRPYQGRGYHMVGPVAVIRGNKPSAEELKELVLWQRPGGVVWIRSLCGRERTPDAELLFGSAGEVLHREQGFSYLIDPTKVMFSPGNLKEKKRMAGLVRPGERVADMYAGIGYFSIPVANQGAKVHAMEINPDAFHYLVLNARLNKVEEQIVPDPGDCRSLLSGEYDRVIMGHFDSVTALPDALLHVHEGSVLHVHSSGGAPPDISDILDESGYTWDISVHTVKKTGPHRWHFVEDVVIG